MDRLRDILMKPIRTKTFLVKQILFALSIMLVLFSYLMLIQEMPFFPTIKLMPVDGEYHLEIGKGLITVSYVASFLAFMASYLIFEFYGFKSALYSVLGCGLAVLLFHGCSELVQQYLLDPENSRMDSIMTEVLHRPLDMVVGYTGGLVAGWTLTLMVAAIIKVITRNYFMVIRYPIAACLGMAAFLAINTYVTGFQVMALQSMPYVAAPTASQLLAMVIGSVIPLYLLRLLFGLFRGRQRDDETDHEPKNKSKGLFKGTKDEPLPAANDTPEPIVEDDEEEEITSPNSKINDPFAKKAKNDDGEDGSVSKKIRFAP